MSSFRDKPIIALDFDGTCVAYDFPRVGHEIGAAPWLRRWTDAGVKLILWTMRDAGLLEDAKRWYLTHDIPLWGVQFNPEQTAWTSSPKPYAKLYVDDHGFGVPLTRPSVGRLHVDWNILGPAVLAMLKDGK